MTPINRAIEGGRDNGPSLDRWLNAHDDWQVVYSVLASNSALASTGQDNAGHWTLYFEAGNGDKIARKVIERTYAEQGDVALRTYEVQEWENLDSDLWITPQAGSLMGLTDTWQQLYDLVQDEEILFTAYWQVREGGLVEEPIWLAGIFYKGEKQGDTRLLKTVTVDLETGLFHSYTGRGDPRDMLGPS